MPERLVNEEQVAFVLPLLFLSGFYIIFRYFLPHRHNRIKHREHRQYLTHTILQHVLSLCDLCEKSYCAYVVKTSGKSCPQSQV